LGFSDAEAERALLKADLAFEIYNIIRGRKLTQAEVGKILGIDPSDISRLKNADFNRFSVERLFTLLNRCRGYSVLFCNGGKMIRIAIVILVLLVGCAAPKLEPQFMGQYLSLTGEPFKTAYPDIKELDRSKHGNYVKYLTLSGKILMARYNDKKGTWQITIRKPHPNEVEQYKEEWYFD
jgi:predicted XRE-type DNA-binding protein